MKKLLSILLVSCLCLSIVGCGQNVDNSAKEEVVAEEVTDSTEDAVSDEIVEEVLEDVENAEVEEVEIVEEAKEEEPAEEFVSDRSEVFCLLSNITAGWNLGNTFDAWGAGNSVSAETYWGNPQVTKEMIDAIKEQGFNSIRIPITYAEHVGEAPDYIIDQAWLDRVKEVVDYAVADDMYIIIDTHHETDKWLVLNSGNDDAMKAELAAIWTQVAETFKDYDEKLIFEGMNEPRSKGSEKEWQGGTEEERVLVNEMNQIFVDTVRATGGNNESRVLVICPYGNSTNMKALKELAIPDDNNIAVAIHMYTPYVFTYVPNGQTSVEVWNGTLKPDIVNTVKMLNDYFIKKDVPVIITEYGAENKGNEEEIVKWLTDYIEAMNKYDIKCYWWDNGYLGGNNNEKFAIFDRETLTWVMPKVADTLIDLTKGE